SATVLGQIEPVPQSAVPSLQAALKDQDMTVRINVAASLCRGPLTLPSPPSAGGEGRVRGQVKEAFPVLVTALTNRALRAQAVAPLAKLVDDEDANVRLLAVRAIARPGRIAADVVPALIKALRDKDSTVRREAVRAVVQMGAAAQAAIPALTDVVKGEQGSNR